MARRVACSSNQRSLSLANIMYASDHNDYYVAIDTPEGYRWFENKEFKKTIGLANRQFGDTPVGSNLDASRMPEEYDCPSDRRIVDTSDPVNRGIMGIGYNITGWHLSVTPYLAHRTTEVRRPDQKIMFMDAQCWMVRVTGADYREFWDVYGEVEGYYTPDGRNVHGLAAYRHNEGANVAFFDGRVEYRTKEEIYPVSRLRRDTERNLKRIWQVRPGLPFP